MLLIHYMGYFSTCLLLACPRYLIVLTIYIMIEMWMRRIRMMSYYHIYGTGEMTASW